MCIDNIVPQWKKKILEWDWALDLNWQSTNITKLYENDLQYSYIAWISYMENFNLKISHRKTVIIVHEQLPQEVQQCEVPCAVLVTTTKQCCKTIKKG